MRLGWAKGDEEIIAPDDMIAWFGFDGMNKAASRFDFAKLEALNGHYIRQAGDAELMSHIERILPEIDGGEAIAAKLINDDKRAKVQAALPLLKERAKTLIELIEGAAFVYDNRPFALTDKAVSILNEEAKERLSKLVDQLTTVQNWNYDELDSSMRAFLEANELKLGKVGPALRCALTGTTNAPGIYEVLELLGRDESLARIKDQLK